ncbi:MULTISPECIES: hypothetical protein [Streptomyces]|uniref:hypothetical protein n=1 Tax=Streptomyces TaxID=1883 RepID=UPI000B9DFD8D|nr:hypothetical protein [Streptomyces kasugaensis]
MGKGKARREQRRRRERAKRSGVRQTATKPSADAVAPLLLLPSAEHPLLRVVISADASVEMRSLCSRYWAMDTDGTWSTRVSDLGMASWVTSSVANCSDAYALHPFCGKETAVRSRTDMARVSSMISGCGDCAGQDRADGTVPPPRQEAGPLDTEAPGNTEREAGLPPLTLQPVHGVPEELHTIGERYWSVAHYDHENALVAWKGTTTTIDTAGWGPAYIAAAAGITASVATHACGCCGGQLTLTSRTAYERLCLGEPAICVDCTPGLRDKIQRLIDPQRIEQRRAERERARRQAVIDKKVSTWDTQWKEWQREAVRARYSFVLTPEAAIPQADVRTEAATLALLRFSPEASPIPPVRTWPADPLHPVPGQAAEVIASATRARLLLVHPDTHINAFVWEPPTLHDALARVGGDLDELPVPQLTNRYLPREATHFVPYGPSKGTAVEALDAHLAKRLEPSQLTGERQEQFLDVVQELIAAEAVRYFDYQLEVRHLPPVPENHVARLQEAAARAAETRSLGELNNIAWLAVVRASDAAQKHPQAPRPNMTTYAVNTFESRVQLILSDPGKKLQPYDHDRISAMSRLVFYNLLDANPFTTTRDDARDLLPPPEQKTDAPVGGPDGAVDLQPETLDSDIRWLHEHQELWSAVEFRDHLLLIRALRHVPDATADDAELAAAARSLQEIFQENQESADNALQAALNTCSAARLLNRLVTREDITGPAGQWIIADFVYRTMGKAAP